MITVTRKAFTRRTLKSDAWMYHLREMAAREDPLEYIRRFVVRREDLEDYRASTSPEEGVVPFTDSPPRLCDDVAMTIAKPAGSPRLNCAPRRWHRRQLFEHRPARADGASVHVPCPLCKLVATIPLHIVLHRQPLPLAGRPASNSHSNALDSAQPVPCVAVVSTLSPCTHSPRSISRGSR